MVSCVRACSRARVLACSRARRMVLAFAARGAQGARSASRSQVRRPCGAKTAGIVNKSLSESFGFPAACFVAGEDEHPHPGEQVTSKAAIAHQI